MAFSNRLDIFNPVLAASGTLGTLSGKVQTNSTFAAAVLDLKVYLLSDNSFTSPVVTGTTTADANGDATIALGMNGIGPNNYVLRVTSTTPALTLTSGTLVVGAAGTLVNFLRDVLCAFVNLERFEEPLMPNTAFDTWRAGWGNWTSDSPWLAEQDELDLSAGSTYKVDYSNGFVFLVNALLQGHDIRATYKFDLLTPMMLLGFLDRSLATVNGYKPATGFTLDSAPSTWLDILILGAYLRALESISMKLATFKYRRLFENPTDMIAQVSARLNEARAEFQALLKMVKRRGYAVPQGLSSLKIGGIPYQVDNINFQGFIITR